MILDHLGQCVPACSESLKEILNPKVAEAMTLRRAVSLAREEGCADLVFKSDCLSVIQRLASPTRDRSAVGFIVNDIKVVASDLPDASFLHVRRHFNILAHVLARSSLNSPSLCIFHYSPDCT